MQHIEKHIVAGELKLWTDVRHNQGADVCLLVNGAGAISAFWPDAFCRRLAASGHTVIRYDHRDSGLSSFVDFERSPYTLNDLVSDAMAVLDAFDVKRAHVVGHSMGGYVAQLLAMGRSERVITMTSISSHTASPDVPPPPPSTWDVMLANQPVGELERDLPGFMKIWAFMNGKRPFDTQMARHYTEELYRRNPKTLPAANHVAIQANMNDRTTGLSSCRAPSLILHGDEDPLVPLAGGRMTAAAIPGAVFRNLHGAGHMFFTESTWQEILQELTAHWRCNR